MHSKFKNSIFQKDQKLIKTQIQQNYVYGQFFWIFLYKISILYCSPCFPAQTVLQRRRRGHRRWVLTRARCILMAEGWGPKPAVNSFFFILTSYQDMAFAFSSIERSFFLPIVEQLGKNGEKKRRKNRTTSNAAGQAMTEAYEL